MNQKDKIHKAFRKILFLNSIYQLFSNNFIQIKLQEPDK
jgi:hypothetical protein